MKLTVSLPSQAKARGPSLDEMGEVAAFPARISGIVDGCRRLGALTVKTLKTAIPPKNTKIAATSLFYLHLFFFDFSSDS